MKNITFTLILVITIITSLNCEGGHNDIENGKPLDFSSVWTSYQDHIFGYVGDNYQRFYFIIDSIKTDAEDSLLYEVWGKYRIKNEIKHYEGLVFVTNYSEIAQYSNIREEHHHSGGQVYSLISEWNLKTKGSDEEIKGRMTSTYYVLNDKAVFNDVDIEYSDSFCNNQFVGMLCSVAYGDKKCQWGTFRIPDSGGLDIGAAEFSPDERYLSYGWQSYHDAIIEGTESSWQKEKQSRWCLQLNE